MQRVGTLQRVVVPIVVAAISVLALAGCVASTPKASKTTAPATAAPSATASAGPTIDLAGTAGQNQAYFDVVNQKFIAAGGDLRGRPFIDNLVKVDFPKANMEVTPDRTAVNLAADNIQFSIRFGTTCLIGQYGNTGYVSEVTKALGTSRCLVGTTRPIDW